MLMKSPFLPGPVHVTDSVLPAPTALRKLERRRDAADLERHAADHAIGVREVVAQQVIAGLVRRTHLERITLRRICVVAVRAIGCADRIDRNEIPLVVGPLPGDLQRTGHFDRRRASSVAADVRHGERRLREHRVTAAADVIADLVVPGFVGTSTRDRVSLRTDRRTGRSVIGRPAASMLTKSPFAAGPVQCTVSLLPTSALGAALTLADCAQSMGRHKNGAECGGGRRPFGHASAPWRDLQDSSANERSRRSKANGTRSRP